MGDMTELATKAGNFSNIVPALKSLSWPISKLDTFEGNARRGDIEAVKASLEVYGQVKPIVARLKKGRGGRAEVIAGNHTLMACKALNWDQMAVVFVEMDDKTATSFNLADNRTADLGGYDNEALLALIQSVMDDEVLFASTGYDDQYVKDLLKLVNPKTVADPDSAPSLPSVAVSKPGDVWLCGPHRVACGDSTKPEVLAALLGTERPDMVWTDPPYGVEVVGGNAMLTPDERKKRGGKTIENDGYDLEALKALLANSFPLAANACRKGAAWFVAAPTGPPFLHFAQVLTDLGIWRQTLVWEKQVFVPGRSDYHYRHEALIYGWVPGAAHTAPPDRKQDSIWVCDRPHRSPEHPTIKPVALIQRAVENHTKVGDIVLDMFGGSGSTMVACHLADRAARLIELDPGYTDVICKRYQESTGTKPVLESTEEPHDFAVEP